jgi:hypothetical protein
MRIIERSHLILAFSSRRREQLPLLEKRVGVR